MIASDSREVMCRRHQNYMTIAAYEQEAYLYVAVWLDLKLLG